MKRLTLLFAALFALASSVLASDPPKSIVHATPFGAEHLLAVFDDGTAGVVAIDISTGAVTEVSSYTAKPKAPPVFRTRWTDKTGTEHEIETKVDEATGNRGQAEAIQDAFALHTTLVTLAQEQYPPVSASGSTAAFLQPGGMLPDKVLAWPAAARAG